MTFTKTIYGELNKLNPFWAIRAMQEMGYVQTSRKFRYVARVDKHLGPNPDWHTEEYCRRITSQDTIQNVPENIMEHLRG